MSQPVISVITVTFNAAKVVEKTIQSVVSQTYDKLEYLIIDGASRDETMDIVDSYRNQIERRGRIVSEPDKGLYDAMNKGIRLARGEWILFLNADDIFVDNQVVSDVVTFIVAHPKAEIVYGNSEQIFEYGIYTVRPKVEGMDRKMSISHQATFIRTDLLLAHPFQSEYRYAADFEQLSHFYLEGRNFIHVNRMIARVEMRGGTTFENTVASAEELYSIIASRGVNIEVERKKMIRHKKMVRAFKRLTPSFISKPIFRLIAKAYKPL